jgi:hypothetical protein
MSEENVEIVRRAADAFATKLVHPCDLLSGALVRPAIHLEAAARAGLRSWPNAARFSKMY